MPYWRAQLFLPANRKWKVETNLRFSIVFLGVAASLLLACSEELSSDPKVSSGAGSALDSQAVSAGILPDPKDVEFAGRYETRSELGVDKFCAVSNGSNSYKIGFLAVFGAESKCEGTGTATIDGENVRVVLNGKGKCAFNARYDGIELRFPGVVERECSTYCSENASMSGTHYFMVQPGNDAARGTLGRKIERLCD